MAGIQAAWTGPEEPIGTGGVLGAGPIWIVSGSIWIASTSQRKAFGTNTGRFRNRSPPFQDIDNAQLLGGLGASVVSGCWKAVGEGQLPRHGASGLVDGGVAAAGGAACSRPSP
jgi:hypothetical protein